ncbi:MAG: hypothetical protein K8R99_01470 [Actinomycetia bacterium]|nr:hypothetical protein [Actinomycetes bacterium]
MNPLQVGALVGVITAAGCWCVVFSFRRAPRSLAIARGRMQGTDGRTAWTDSVAAGGLGRWVAKRFGSGLPIVQLTPAAVVTKVIVAAGVMLFAVLAGVAALMSLGALALSPVWPIFAVSCALLAGWVSLNDVASKIDRQRREIRRASNDFVQLVAVGLTTDQSVEEAISFALAVGASESFDTLRQHISAAPQRGVAVWEALDEFGRDYDVREISELAASIERQGVQGVSIGETVATLSEAMRAKALDDLERAADKANANLSGPTVGFVVTTIVFLAYPLAQRISEAFGG